MQRFGCSHGYKNKYVQYGREKNVVHSLAIACSSGKPEMMNKINLMLSNLFWLMYVPSLFTNVSPYCMVKCMSKR